MYLVTCTNSCYCYAWRKPAYLLLILHAAAQTAQVFRATWNDVQTVAVKQLLQHDARNDIRFLREIAILKECRSTHVVQFLVRLPHLRVPLLVSDAVNPWQSQGWR